MKSTHKVMSLSLTAYILLALVCLDAESQVVSAPATHGIVTANMDPSVRPGDDFYQFANGTECNKNARVAWALLTKETYRSDRRPRNQIDFRAEIARARGLHAGRSAP